MNADNCGQVETLLGAYVDSELDAKTSLEISLHLRECPACATLFAEETAWQQRLQAALNEGRTTEGLWETIEERVRGSGRSQSAPVRPKSASAARDWRYWLWPSPRLYAGLAAAWALILGVQMRTGEPGHRGASATPETPAALIEQRHLLAELLGTHV